MHLRVWFWVIISLTLQTKSYVGRTWEQKVGNPKSHILWEALWWKHSSRCVFLLIISDFGLQRQIRSKEPSVPGFWKFYNKKNLQSRLFKNKSFKDPVVFINEPTMKLQICTRLCDRVLSSRGTHIRRSKSNFTCNLVNLKFWTPGYKFKEPPITSSGLVSILVPAQEWCSQQRDVIHIQG